MRPVAVEASSTDLVYGRGCSTRTFCSRAFDRCGGEWDIPTMRVRIVDSKRRIVLGAALPGQAFGVAEESDGRIVLTRLEPVRSTRQMSFDECRAAIEAAPLRPALSWDELREVTREP